MEETYPVIDLCAAFDVSRAGFYSWRQRQPSARDRADTDLGVEIDSLFARSRRTYGSPRLHRALRRAEHACGRYRVARLMRHQRLAGRVRGRRRPFTTDSDHEQPIAPNRLGQRQVPVERPNEVWAVDITYVPTEEGWLYLAGVLDLGSRRVVGWAMGESLDAWDVTPSMSRRANCYDNAAMESFWSTLKEELVYRRSFASCSEAADAIFDCIETFYNRERLHSALGFISPVEFEKQINLN